MRAWRALAPAKINLGLFVGTPRQDGRHELVSVMQSISLADELVLEEHDGPGDEVVCPGVAGENLAAEALAAFRTATSHTGPSWRCSIAKRVPVAAGLGGGSGDAAAALRLARAASGAGSEELLLALAAELGADVAAQVRPGRWLATGAGERIERLPDPAPFGVLVLPAAQGLSTAAVYREADRLGGLRESAELERVRRALTAAGDIPAGPLLANDLQRAALSLRPDLEGALERVSATGADATLLSGSGPTVLGLFAGPGGPARARAAAEALGASAPAAMVAEPVAEPFAAPAVD